LINSGDPVKDDLRKSSDNEPEPDGHPHDSSRKNSGGSEVSNSKMDIETPAKKKISEECPRLAKTRIDGASRKVRRSLELRKNLCVLLCKL
jgi:hypothetical protein